MEGPFIALRVAGESAMWTMPHLRADPYSAPIPAKSALVGLLKAVYGKPEFVWDVTRLFLLAPIRRQVETVRHQKESNRKWTKPAIRRGDADMTLRSLSFLVGVDYVIEAQPRLNPLREDMAQEWDLRAKHAGIFEDRARNGKAFDVPYFGDTDRIVEHYGWAGYGGVPAPFPGDITADLGVLLLDRIPVDIAKDIYDEVFWHARIHHGVVTYPPRTEAQWTQAFAAEHKLREGEVQTMGKARRKGKA